MRCKSFLISDINQLQNYHLLELDIAFVNYEKELSLTEELRNPEVIKEWSDFSGRNKIVVFVHFVAKIEKKKFLSIMVIDNGRIIGVSDAVTKNKEYYESKRQRIYITSLGKIGVVVDDDILYPESVRSLNINGAEIIVSMSKKNFDTNYLNCYKSHNFFNDVLIFGIFNDKLCIFSKDMYIAEKNSSIEFDLIENYCDFSFIKKFENPSYEY